MNTYLIIPQVHDDRGVPQLGVWTTLRTLLLLFLSASFAVMLARMLAANNVGTTIVLYLLAVVGYGRLMRVPMQQGGRGRSRLRVLAGMLAMLLSPLLVPLYYILYALEGLMVTLYGWQMQDV